MKRLVLAMLAVLLLLAVPAGAWAADTKLGEYEEAPYKDVVKIEKEVIPNVAVYTHVKIPYEHVFSPEKLERTVVINGREWEDLVIVFRDSGGSYYVFDMFEKQVFTHNISLRVFI